jgi:hypothetical protein
LRQRAVQSIKIMGPFNPALSYQYGDLVTLPTSPPQTWICTNKSFTLPTATPSTNPLDWLRLL